MPPVLAGVLALVLAAFTLGHRPQEPPRDCLTIRRFPSQTLVERFALPRDGRFALSFVHSVSRTPVRDDYRAADGRIVQTAETFEHHGAGLPSGVDESDGVGWEQGNGRFVLRLQRTIPRLIVRTDRNYRNRLHLGDRVVDLNAWEDQALELAIVPCTAP